jgi:hypothetical protein
MTKFVPGKISSAEIKTWTDIFVEPCEYWTENHYTGWYEPNLDEAKRHVILCCCEQSA